MSWTENGNGARETLCIQTETQRKGRGERRTGGGHDAHCGESKNVHLPEGERREWQTATGGKGAWRTLWRDPQSGGSREAGKSRLNGMRLQTRRRRRARARRHPHVAALTVQSARSTAGFFSIFHPCFLGKVSTQYLPGRHTTHQHSRI